MARRQVIMLEVTTGAGHDAPAEWDWNTLIDGNGTYENVRVIGAGEVSEVVVEDEDEDDGL